MTLDAYGRWCVWSNLKRIKDEGLDLDTVVMRLRANGYSDTAAEVERQGRAPEFGEWGGERRTLPIAIGEKPGGWKITGGYVGGTRPGPDTRRDN